jgi:tetratricopeptide (TPR) repeat protein
MKKIPPGRSVELVLFLICLAAALGSPTASKAGPATEDTEKVISPECGKVYTPPFGEKAPPRTCPERVARSYSAKYKGLGYDILNQETEACFVPDSSYKLLDEIIDRVTVRLSKEERTGAGISEAARVEAISHKTGDVLAELGFGLYIPTETLGDALVSRTAEGQPHRYIFDCDTGSMILLTIADHLHVPAALVEMTLQSGNQHNYVRWKLSHGGGLNWDTNGRTVCTQPARQPSYQGQAMSRAETLGYTALLRAPLWQKQGQFARALKDYQFDIQARPGHPASYNNFAWLVAANEFPERASYKVKAIEYATRAVALHKSAGAPELSRHDTANDLDTLACAYAYNRDYKRAIATEDEALSIMMDDGFKKRRALFAQPIPVDCTGAT